MQAASTTSLPSSVSFQINSPTQISPFHAVIFIHPAVIFIHPAAYIIFIHPDAVLLFTQPPSEGRPSSFAHITRAPHAPHHWGGLLLSYFSIRYEEYTRVICRPTTVIRNTGHQVSFAYLRHCHCAEFADYAFAVPDSRSRETGSCSIYLDFMYFER